MNCNSDGVYRRDDRSGYWISWTDAQGRRRFRKTNARTLQQARAARGAELVRVEQAKCLGFAPPGKDTFADVAVRFLAHQKARLTPKAYERESGIVDEHLKSFFAGPLAAIRRVDIQRYVTKRSGDVSAHSVQKELNVLKHLLRVAVEWEVIPYSRAQGVKSPRVPTGRVRYLQPTELRSLLAACPEWLRPIVGVAVSTGMRRSEVLGLRWLDVDTAHASIMLPQTKNGDGRIVYLNKSALAALGSVSRSDAKGTDRIFSSVTPEQVSVGFARLCRKEQILDFRFHDLRHTAASWLRMQGADIHTVAQLLGHKDLRMAARYQHLSPAFLADAVAKLDGAFGLVVPAISGAVPASQQQLAAVAVSGN
jgi:integrase